MGIRRFVCKGCGIEKDEYEFRRARTKSGRAGKCDDCRRIDRKLRRRAKKLQLLQDQFYLYILIDPRTNCVRYVGIAKNYNKRFSDHLREARAYTGTNSPKDAWIRALLELELEPSMVVIGQAAENEIYNREKETLGLLLKQGYDMLNISGIQKAEAVANRSNLFDRNEFSKKPKYTPSD